MKKISFIVLCFIFLLTGCATNTSAIQIDASNLTLQNNLKSNKTVFIRQVLDERTFNPKTRDPSVPSVEYKTEYEKDHAIGRKRNGYGKAIGKIVFKESQSVKEITKDVIMQAFIDNGYKIIDRQNNINDNTLIIDISIKEFWAWMQPCYWYISLTNNISVDLIQINTSNKVLHQIEGRYNDWYLLGTAGDYADVIQKSFDKFYTDAKNKVRLEFNNSSYNTPSGYSDYE